MEFFKQKNTSGVITTSKQIDSTDSNIKCKNMTQIDENDENNDKIHF